MMNVLRFLLGMLAILMMVNVSAQQEDQNPPTEPAPSQGVTQGISQVRQVMSDRIPPTDLTYQSLRVLFGDVVDFMLDEDALDIGTESPSQIVDNPGRTILGDIYFFWNHLILGFAVILFTWNLFSWFFQSAHTGRHDKQIDAIGLPLRSILMLGLLLPTASGFCFAQYAYLYVAKYNIKVSNQIAGIIYDGVEDRRQFSSSMPMRMDDFINRVFVIESCTRAMGTVDVDNADKWGITQKEIPRFDEDTLEEVIEVNIEYGYIGGSIFSSLFGYSSDACGSIEIESEAISNRYTDGVAESQYLREYSGLLESILNTNSGPYQEIGMAANQVVGCMVEWNDDDECGAETVRDAQQYLQIAKRRARDQLKTIVEEYHLARQEYARRVPVEMSITQNFSPRQLGWMAVGGLYWVESIRTREFLKFTNSLQPNGNVDVDSDVLETVELLPLWPMVMSASGGASTTVIGVDADERASLLETSFSSVMGGLMVDTILWQVKESNDPLYSLMELGHELIVAAEILYLAKLGGSAFVNTVKGSSGSGGEDEKKGGFINRVKDTASRNIVVSAALTAIEDLVTLINGLIVAMFAMGFYLAFYLPILPMMHWLGQILAVLVSLVEGVLLAPLHALAHLFKEGHGLAGKNGMSGYMMLASAFVRMQVTVITFLSAIGVLTAIGKITFIIYVPFITSMVSTQSVVGIVSFFGMFMSLIVVLTMVIEKTFTLFGQVNDRAIRFIGLQADSMLSAPGEGKEQFTSFSSSLQSAGGELLKPPGKDKALSPNKII